MAFSSPGRYIPLIVISSFLLSCGPKPQPVLFPVKGIQSSEEISLLGLNNEAASGKIHFAKPVKLDYRFPSEPFFSLNEPLSMELVYSINIPYEESFQFILDTGDKRWALPLSGGTIIHYAIPAEINNLQGFSVYLTDGNYAGLPGVNAESHFRIHSVDFKKRWFGFSHQPVSGYDHFYTSPFVSRISDIWTADIPDRFNVPAGYYFELFMEKQPGNTAFIKAGSFHFDFSSYSGQIKIPAGILAPDSGPVMAGADAASFTLGYAKLNPFPEPVPADPGMVLSWPQENWRDKRYEVFRWDRFPSLLIFDTADYTVQDRLLKRLAFFVEKAGFRGRLAQDYEIAELHGWNAHDYRAEDLARFFQTARQENFPLLPEELELERILLSSGIIKFSGGILQAGEGGIISISRESENYLRSRFMAHEGFHGLLFIDEDFYRYSRSRWLQFNAEAKRFIVSYFNYQRYDTADEYLLINEFMAHILQQPVSQAGRYFGETLPSRIEPISWRYDDLPEKDTISNSWPSLAETFTREAEAFSSWVENKWGLAAGRVNLVTVKRIVNKE